MIATRCAASSRTFSPQGAQRLRGAESSFACRFHPILRHDRQRSVHRAHKYSTRPVLRKVYTEASAQKSREDLVAELEPQRARILKQRLEELNVDTSSCYDKESLLTKLVDTMLQQAEKVGYLVVRMCCLFLGFGVWRSVGTAPNLVSKKEGCYKPLYYDGDVAGYAPPEALSRFARWW
eukprot:397327-Prorocentrum_minimum.AAC.1